MIHSRGRFFLALMAASALAQGALAASPFEDALTSAYESNPRIKEQRQLLESTDESIAQAVSGFRPTINATYDKGRQETSFDNAPYSVGNYDTKVLRLDQPLFRGGGTFAALNSARQRVKSGQYDLSAVEQQVLLDAVTAYMDVVADTAILELSRNNERLLADQLKATNTRFQVGEVTRTDVAQSQSRLSNAKTEVIAAEGALRVANATFERVVGYKPEGMLAQPEKMPELPASLSESLEQGRGANPQLLSAIHAAKSSLYDVRSNEAAILPSVSLVGNITRQDGAGVLGVDKFDQDQIGVEVRIPLYQSGAEYSRVRAAKAVSRQRDQATVDTRQSVDQSVTQGWEQLQTAVQTIGTREDQIKAAQVALEGVKQENQFGARTVLDVLDAEQELFNARTNLVRAQHDRVVAAYTLSFRLGQLTPTALALNTTPYDPKEHMRDVSWQPIGF